jgi:hypothetical protein
VKTRLQLSLFIMISTPILISAAILSAHKAVADTANSLGNPGQYHVQSLDPNFDVSPFAAPGVVVQQAKAPKQDASAMLPSTDARDKAFNRAGISADLTGWDQLDRDQLYLRAEHMNEERVIAYYPKLPKKKLGSLVQMLHDQMREEAASK